MPTKSSRCNNNDDDKRTSFGGNKIDIRHEISARCVRLVNEAMLVQGLPTNTVVSKLMSMADEDRTKTGHLRFLLGVIVSIVIGLVAIVLTVTLTDAGSTSHLRFVDPAASMMHSIFPSSSRCLLDNNFLVREATRPPTNCSVCEGVTGAHVLSTTPITRDSFAEHAYSGRPVLAKGAALNWSATTTFSFDFFRRLYLTDGDRAVDGALDSVEDECQFFPFRTKFVTLADVFAMPVERANGTVGQESWYIGWSNCDPRVAQILRKHYSRPEFLPADSESSAIDWIFMGWPGQGASVHLDYVQRPSWQAQISGRKTWRLFPVPECEHVCGSFQITVEKGDIVLVDTNQWYHDTFIEPGEISITIGSEYD